MSNIKNIIDKFNPLQNKRELGNGINIKWKIGLSQDKEQTKLKFTINKSYKDVDFYAVVEGKPFLINPKSIDIEDDPESGDPFKITLGATTSF